MSVFIDTFYCTVNCFGIFLDVGDYIKSTGLIGSMYCRVSVTDKYLAWGGLSLPTGLSLGLTFKFRFREVLLQSLSVLKMLTLRGCTDGHLTSFVSHLGREVRR